MQTPQRQKQQQPRPAPQQTHRTRPTNQQTRTKPPPKPTTRTQQPPPQQKNPLTKKGGNQTKSRAAPHNDPANNHTQKQKELPYSPTTAKLDGSGHTSPSPAKILFSALSYSLGSLCTNPPSTARALRSITAKISSPTG